MTNESCLHCSMCRDKYKLQPPGKRIPYLLSCSHAICGNCIDSQKENKRIKCPKCFSITQFEDLDKLTYNFKDIYLIGLLYCEVIENTFEANPTEEEKHKTEETSEATHIFCKSCKGITSKSCNVCQWAICDTCFEDTHAKHSFFKNHKLIEEQSESKDFFGYFLSQEFCPIHHDKDTVFCVTCDQRICTSCNHKHASHKLISVEAENANQLPFACDFHAKLQETYKSAADSFKALETYKADCVQVGEKANTTIDDGIAKLISTLQVIRVEKKQELQAAVEQLLLPIEKTKSRFTADILKLSATISQFDILKENPPKTVLFKDIVNNISKILSNIIVELRVQPLDNTFELRFTDEMPKKLKKSAKLRIKHAGAEPKITRIGLASIHETNEAATRSNSSGHRDAIQENKAAAQQLRAPKEKSKVKSEAENSEINGRGSLLHCELSTKSSESGWSGESSDEDLPEGCKVRNRATSFRPDSSLSCSMKLVPLDSTDMAKHSESPTLQTPEVIKTPSTFYKFLKPKLICSLMFDAKILHFESFDCFYVGKVSPKNEYDHQTLLEKMQIYYSNPTCPVANDPFDGFLCAVPDDGFWRRGIVKSVKKDQVKVYLVDIGKVITTIKTNVKLLKYSFIKITAAAAIKCSLADIKPKKQYDSIYPEKAIKEFKKLTINSGFIIRVLPKDIAPEGLANPVVIYAYPNNGTRINLNAMLVVRMECAISTGSNSLEMLEVETDALHKKKVVAKRNGSNEIKKRMEVEILKFVSPNEFYAVLRHKVKDFKQIHSETQEAANLKDLYRKLNGNPPKDDWIVDDKCFASHANEKGQLAEWYRATVLGKIPDSSMFEVFLIDKGLRVIVSPDEMLEKPEAFQNPPPAAVRMHIPGASPTGGPSWTKSSLEFFKRVLASYESIWVGVVGDKDENQSLPVIVWGVVIEKSPFIEQRRLHNIANHVCLEGYMYSSNIDYQELANSERAINDNDFGWVDSGDTESLLETLSSNSEPIEMTLGGLTIENQPHVVATWLQSDPESETNFFGVPKNIDENGIIYIVNEKQMRDLEDLKSMLGNIYSELPRDDPVDNKIIVGQPVIAYHSFDLCYYRGEVKSLPNGNNLYNVEFVDYGTVEKVTREDIYCKVVASNIPIMSKKFRLSSVVPMEIDDNEWPVVTIDFIYGKIVDSDVEITIQKIVDDIHECSIRVINDNMDIGKLLIEKRLARPRHSSYPWPPMKNLLPEQSNGWKRSDMKTYKQQMEEEKFDDLVKKFVRPQTVVVSPEEMKKYLKKQNEDLNVDCFSSLISSSSSLTGYVRRPVISPMISAKENRYSARTPYHMQRKRVTPLIPFFDLQSADVKEFHCIFANIVDEKIYLLPDIPELGQKQVKMQQMLEKIDIKLLTKFKKPAENRLCLAFDGSKWYRGSIIRLLENGKNVEVFLVDTAKRAQFQLSQIRKIEGKIKEFPRQALAVVLHGVALNDKFPDQAELTYLRLATYLEGSKLRAVLRGHDAKDYPQVDLFHMDGKLAYQRLIDKKYFIRL